MEDVLELFFLIIRSAPELSLLLFILVAIIVENRARKRRKITEQREEQRLRLSGINEVDRMKGDVFEKYLKALLKKRGYKVDTTSFTGDYGADLVLSNNDDKIVVQAKRYSSKVGIKAVQEIVSAKNYYGANECWVVTNNYYTGPAINLATSNNVKLIDRNMLIEWMIEDKACEIENKKEA